jgi:hypothetical protein
MLSIENALMLPSSTLSFPLPLASSCLAKTALHELSASTSLKSYRYSESVTM